MNELNQRLANLSPEKRQLLLERLKQVKPNAIGPQPRTGEPLALSFPQQRLWLLDRLEPQNPTYNIPQAYRLRGRVDVERLRDSLNSAIARHEALRTVFQEQEGQPQQRILPHLTLALPVIDLQPLPPKEREQQVQQQAIAAAQFAFDLSQGPLLRALLLQLDSADWVLLLTIHHIIADGWSIGILMQELSRLYVCAALPELPIQYADFAVWQKQTFGGEKREAQLAYWQQQLAGVNSTLTLPSDRPRPAVLTSSGATQSLRLSASLSQDLKLLSQKAGVTLFVTLLAAFQTLLYRYTQQVDIAVGTTVSGRDRAETQSLIGLFVNTLVMRTDLSGNPSFRQLLNRVRQVAFGAYAHQDLPFEQLVEELRLERSLSHTPLFQILFQLQNLPMTPLSLPGVEVSRLPFDPGTARFDLTLEMVETEDGLIAIAQYRTDLFTANTITRMLEGYQTLLAGIIANPDREIATLPLLTPAEQHQLLVERNNTQVDYPQRRCLHHWVEQQVEQTPDAVAVVFENHSLTYRQLNLKANQLAHHLQSLGVGIETLVGVCTERSLEMVIALLAILKAGAAYVPFDPTYPKARLAFMLQDSQVQVLLTQSHLIESLPQHPAQIVDLDSDFSAYPADNLQVKVTPDNLAYVIYTSGSTGQPKGAMNLHRGVVNRLLWMQEAYGLTATERILQKTPFSFDVSVWEFFWPLITGARLIVAQPGGHQDSHYLVNLIQSQQITTLHFVPSMLQVFLQETGVENCQSLKRVICSGEALSWELQQRFFSKLNAQLHNLYGPTEAAIDVTFWECHPDSQLGKVPIGRPIANTEIYLLDQHQQPVPIGVAGELHIGGMGLARGYLNRPELTAEKFISNPFKAGKLYKTGDLARYLETGEIEYLGRIDHQVKLRGLRIELGEIEATLLQHPDILACTVAVIRDYLAAYLVLSPQASLNVEQLQQFLQQTLPDYMIPAVFVPLAELPLTPNGKLDRSALPAPDIAPAQATFISPRNPTETWLAGLFAEILGQERVGITDNFFALGGHSLLATQVISRVRTHFQLEVPLRALFEKPTIAGFAERLETLRLAQRQVVPSLAGRAGRKDIEL
ncbi:amino acid adenylation domain-containing protein [Kamptonema cortianum]|uniref:Amino acid adenylation domain-containing protein n=1 Tax=Geitlerinema calcuttense NRMC-F 0142 TaxID=2922238 RepID=A0ABT7LZX6_9CYAN|nr:amino acid adenylation domain-containing protein [Geitlerinema calcuttense]MDK3158300.1 amino acid adenylation domain-containing protein [Kamptonema cortianum]MDL5057564.1 amino acid adenylation domain-containing protein [Geitlerinema calcuttense NRMC-F 0142]